MQFRCGKSEWAVVCFNLFTYFFFYWWEAWIVLRIFVFDVPVLTYQRSVPCSDSETWQGSWGGSSMTFKLDSQSYLLSRTKGYLGWEKTLKEQVSEGHMEFWGRPNGIVNGTKNSRAWVCSYATWQTVWSYSRFLVSLFTYLFLFATQILPEWFTNSKHKVQAFLAH